MNKGTLIIPVSIIILITLQNVISQSNEINKLPDFIRYELSLKDIIKDWNSFDDLNKEYYLNKNDNNVIQLDKTDLKDFLSDSSYLSSNIKKLTFDKNGVTYELDDGSKINLEQGNLDKEGNIEGIKSIEGERTYNLPAIKFTPQKSSGDSSVPKVSVDKSGTIKITNSEVSIGDNKFIPITTEGKKDSEGLIKLLSEDGNILRVGGVVENPNVRIKVSDTEKGKIVNLGPNENIPYELKNEEIIKVEVLEEDGKLKISTNNFDSSSENLIDVVQLEKNTEISTEGIIKNIGIKKDEKMFVSYDKDGVAYITRRPGENKGGYNWKSDFPSIGLNFNPREFLKKYDGDILNKELSLSIGSQEIISSIMSNGVSKATLNKNNDKQIINAGSEYIWNVRKGVKNYFEGLFWWW